MYLVENQTTEQAVHEYKFLREVTECTKGAEGTKEKPGKRNQYMYYEEQWQKTRFAAGRRRAGR